MWRDCCWYLFVPQNVVTSKPSPTYLQCFRVFDFENLWDNPLHNSTEEQYLWIHDDGQHTKINQINKGAQSEHVMRRNMSISVHLIINSLLSILIDLISPHAEC